MDQIEKDAAKTVAVLIFVIAALAVAIWLGEAFWYILT